MRFVLLFSIAMGAATSVAAEELKPFVFSPQQGAAPAPAQVCKFSSLKLPADHAVFAAGAYAGPGTGFQIDQSGHEATQIDVAVHSPGKPVVLMLGAYEPNIWNIGWSEGTKVLAVLASGYHRQAVAGLPKDVPVLISTYDNRGPCGYFYVTPDTLEALNPKARALFGKPVDMVYPAANGKVAVGVPLTSGTRFVTSSAVTPLSFKNPVAPLAGPAGLEDAVRQGLLRKATSADAQAWSEALAEAMPARDVPPVAGQGVPKPPAPFVHNGYVVLKPFVYPSGLYGANSATFFVPKGVPLPTGTPGHSSVYDFNSLTCSGPSCRTR